MTFIQLQVCCDNDKRAGEQPKHGSEPTELGTVTRVITSTVQRTALASFHCSHLLRIKD